MIFSFDWETWLIGPACQLPPGVCLSWSEIVPNAGARGGYVVGRSGVMDKRDGCDYLLRWLEAGAALVGANTAFDALVSVITCATLGGDWKRLLKAWADAYEQGRVKDVLVRQKLLDIAAFGDKYEQRSDGYWITHGYSLADVSKRLTGRVLDKPTGADDTAHWRLRFGELDNVPVAEYPKAAFDYALEDSVATAEDFIVQEYERTSNALIRRNFPGRDPFVDETRQTMCCVPLKAMAAYGLRTDGPSVERFAEEVQEKILEARADLVDAGLVRPPAYHRSTEAAVAYIKANGLLEHFEERDGIAEPVIKLHKSRYLAAFQATGDVNLWRLANFLDMSKDPKAYAPHLQGMIEAGLVEVEHSRDTKAAAEMAVRSYAEIGLPAPRTDGYKKKEHGPLVNEKGEILLNLNCVSLDADACSGSQNPLLEVYSEYSSLAKTVANDIPMLRGGVTMPVHTRFDELKKTGRTGSSKPNVQNVRRLPGIRECFVPRPGFVFISTDFAMLELHTLAQVCKWTLGFSTLGEALNAGRDPHLQIAAAIMNIDYQTAQAKREAGDSETDNARTAGKGCFHPDTEVLTSEGWIKVGELNLQSLVCSARFDGERTTLEYAPPIALTERDWNGELVHVKNEGIDLRLTPDHRMVGWEAQGKENALRLITCVPEEVPDLRYWPNAGRLDGEIGATVDERLLRLAVAAQADGHIMEDGRLKFGFTKQRKINRLTKLLGEDEYTQTPVGKLQVETFKLSQELSAEITALLDQKRFPFWWTKLDERSREIVLEEVEYWDSCGAKTQKAGNKRAGFTYGSTIRQNVEVLQTIATITDRKTRLIEVSRTAPRSTIWHLSIKGKNRSRGGHVSTKRIPYVGKVFCLTTHNDSVVVRDGGVPVITRQCNFGAAGGLSAKTFVVYAWTNYRIRLTLEESQRLIKLYHDTWKEIPAYFNWVKSHKDPYSIRKVLDEATGQMRETCRYNLVQPWSGRLRASAAYCEACNSPFQGLGADVAKLALWLVWKATIGLSELGEDDPLFGAHPVNFVHDDIMSEVLEARANAAAMRQKELLELAGRIVLPDVPVKSDMLVCRQWSKKAQQRRVVCHACGSHGKCACGTWKTRELVPWDLREACREALEAWAAEHAAEGRDAGFQYLQKKQWPSDVAREAVGEYFGGVNVVGKAAA